MTAPILRSLIIRRGEQLDKLGDIRAKIRQLETAKQHANTILAGLNNDFIRENAAIFEQAETQRLINQAQQTVETENATPLEENMIGG